MSTGEDYHLEADYEDRFYFDEQPDDDFNDEVQDSDEASEDEDEDFQEDMW